MNILETENHAVAKALEAFHQITGIKAEIKTTNVNNPEGDNVIQLTPEIGKVYTYVVEIKNVDRFAHLADLKNRFGEQVEERLVIVPRITDEMANKCKDLHLQFIDTAGNAYLKRLGLYVFIKGLRHDKNLLVAKPEGKRAGTATNLRVVFVLLCKQELLNATYREIKDIAGVALGTIGWIFYDLDHRRYTLKDKDGRVLQERKKLIQEWITNYPIKLRPKLNTRRFKAPDADWWKTVDITKYKAQWGAEVAATKLTGYLRPQTYTIYFQAKDKQKNITEMVIANKLRADPQGEIELLDAFWNFDEETLPENVPPILIYADLLTTLEPRNLDTAKLIYDKYIDDERH